MTALAPGGSAAVEHLLSTHFSLDWYIHSWFSSPLEVHSTELGVFAGIVLAMLILRGHIAVALGLMVYLLIFALGFPNGEWLCSSAPDNCVSNAVQGKPWYFLIGMLTTMWIIPGVISTLSRRRSSDLATQLEQVRDTLGDDATLAEAMAFLSGNERDTRAGNVQYTDGGQDDTEERNPGEL
ncbi:hypothetical protein [Haloarchaeobius sp. HME9146]|uniref:hypothetical protein n=1 Tax=Haloarchaeobius sp. HME9146 TaxID=2978732 RepID=UPI0021C092DE|nr:hypothetical protein [Haloarchaeobius sp. HME9146]MCT9098207.1 hypothetical protein [Haloarchaeobius sp. HME9146]